jgi:hypothetical protein
MSGLSKDLSMPLYYRSYFFFPLYPQQLVFQLKVKNTYQYHFLPFILYLWLAVHLSSLTCCASQGLHALLLNASARELFKASQSAADFIWEIPAINHSASV